MVSTLSTEAQRLIAISTLSTEAQRLITVSTLSTEAQRLITVSTLSTEAQRLITVSTPKKKLVVKDLADGSRTISCKNGGNDTLAALRQLRREKSLCDIIIKVEDGEVWAHRNILAINSPYFHAMFLEGFSEAHTRHVQLQGLYLPNAQTLVDFMYSGNLRVTATSVQGLIMGADLWQMTEVKDLCESYMERLIDAENCLGIGQFAELYTCQRLVQRSLHLLKQRFPLVAQGSEFLRLSPSQLLDILTSLDLALGHEGEDVVARALFRWLDCRHLEVTSDQLTALLRAVQWSATSLPCRRTLLPHPVLADSPELQKLVQSLVEERSGVGRRAQVTLYVIGGFLQSRTGPKCPRLRSVERLDPLSSRWMACADLPMLSSSAVAFSLHGHLLCCACEPVPVGGGRGGVVGVGVV
ncbi:hypothetical protein ACOMHN_061203 [Nucella lapillus]